MIEDVQKFQTDQHNTKKLQNACFFVLLDLYVLKIKKENKQKFGNFCSESPFLKIFQTQMKS